MNAARNATSVLPKPTSPHTRRSIGLPRRHVGDHGGDRRRPGRAFPRSRSCRRSFRSRAFEARTRGLRARAARVQIAAIRRRCRAPAARPCAWLSPTGPSRARAAARLPAIGAGVARDHVQLRDRHVELACRSAYSRCRNSVSPSPRSIDDQTHDSGRCRACVHDRVADLQLGQVAHHRIDVARLFLAAPSGAARERAVQLGLGDESTVPFAGDSAKPFASGATPSEKRARRWPGSGEAVATRAHVEVDVGEVAAIVSRRPADSAANRHAVRRLVPDSAQRDAADRRRDDRSRDSATGRPAARRALAARNSSVARTVWRT